MQKKLLNPFGEKLDLQVEGNPTSEQTLILVHGFGTNKHETQGLFDDLTQAFIDQFRIVRFDFSGYGQSEGKQEEADYQKQTRDLEAILVWVKKRFPGKIYLYAHSMGCFVTALLAPDGIERIVLGAIPNANSDFIVERFRKRIQSKPGGKFDEQDTSLYPRSSGELQKVGPNFWRVLRAFDQIQAIKVFAKKTKLLIIHPLDDEIVSDEFMDTYKRIPGVEYKEIPGDHSFVQSRDRNKLVQTVKSFLERE